VTGFGEIMDGSIYLSIVPEVVQTYLLLDVLEMTAGKCILISASVLDLAIE
jgi:hypothetical protein